MKFVLNASNLKSAAAFVCIEGLAHQLRTLGHDAVINDWERYDCYDVAIFMAADLDACKVRSVNPEIKIGVVDPKPSTLRQAGDADFCIVSSIEQREVFLPFNRNLFIYYMIPDFERHQVVHREKKRYRIVYHGNKVHLNGAYHGLVPALNELGKRYPIQLDVIYNINELGIWTMGRPDERYCQTNDLQWYPNCYKEYFKDADIGVVPNLMPWQRERLVRQIGEVSKMLLLESDQDHVVKYKSSANAGRAFVFGYFGIPVVAEAVPSASDAIVDGCSGRLVLSAAGWYDALEEMILSPRKREKYATAFRLAIEERFSPRVSAERLVSYVSQLEKKPKVYVNSKTPLLLIERFYSMRHRARRKLNSMLDNK